MRRPSHHAAALALALALVACGGEARQEAAAPTPPKDAPAQAVPVRAVTVAKGQLESRRTVSATLAAATDSVVVAEASGRVVRVLRKAGDRVAQGEAVLRLDDAALRDSLEEARLNARSARVNLETASRQNPEDRAQAQKRLLAAQTALDNARRVAKANAELYAMGGVSAVELRNSRSAADGAAAELEAASAAVARLGRAGREGLRNLELAVDSADTRVRQLERDLSRASVRAPFAGEVAEVTPQVGEYLASGARAFRLVDPSSLRLNFAAPADDAARLAVGRGVRIAVGTRAFEGRVSRNSGVPGEDRLVRVQARFVGGAPLAGLRPGGAARLEYRVPVGAGVLVPTGALRLEGGQRSVMIVKNGAAARREVQVVGESGGRVAVSGLAAGVQVIFPVPSSLSAGKPVRVVGGAQ